MQTRQFTLLKGPEIDQLEKFLESIEGAMSFEAVDGFFCALISGPDHLLPSAYMPLVFGVEAPGFGSYEQGSEIIRLLLQHWSHIAGTLAQDEVYFPAMFEDESGKCRGNDWADGYMLAVELRRESWYALLEDRENSGLAVPILALYFEHSDDPKFRPKPITDKKRKYIIEHMIASILPIYQYFAPQRQRSLQQSIQHQQPKIEHNDACYRGSGTKFTYCHGEGYGWVTVH